MIKVSGTGCTLLDFLYDQISFKGELFKEFQSSKPGDGGLVPGQLVFLEDFERYCNLTFEAFLEKVTKGIAPKTINLGGPAVVSMIHASQLAGKNIQYRFFAPAGNDQHATTIKNFLNKTPLKNSVLITRNDRTPFTIVLSDPTFNQYGERTFINNIGAAGKISISDLPSDFFDADIIALGGTALVPRLHDQLDELLERVNDESYVIVNTVFDFRNERNHPQTPWPIGKNHDSFERIDLLIMDRDEALKISGMSDLNSAAEYFIISPLKAFMITSGADPVIVSYRKNAKNHNTFSLPISQTLLAKSASSNGDTTGAGDNFVGGVIHAIASQLEKEYEFPDLLEAAKWGIVSGGFACTYYGGTYFEKEPGEKMEKITALLKDYENQIG